MQKWEYLTVEIQMADRRFRPARVNGREPENWKSGPDIYAYLVAIGDEGWEMVTYVSGSYFFKRPKAD